MATGQKRQYKSTRQTTYRNSQYLYGSAVPKPRRVLEEQPERRGIRRTEEKPSLRPAKQTRAKKNRFSVPYFMFLMCTIIFCGFVLVNYVTMRSEITAKNEKIMLLESTLNDMRLENDEDYSRIKNGIDLDAIKMKAIGKLGMTYATEGQIIYYTELDDDYVRQVSDIPKK